MTPEQQLYTEITSSLQRLFPESDMNEHIQLQKTNKEFAGDLTLVTFPFAKAIRKSPEETSKMIGEDLKTHSSLITDYQVVKGFLNLTLADSVWIPVLIDAVKTTYGKAAQPSGKTYLVEYSSPNTNKPLHLGHLRNNFLGYAVSEILKANGHRVVKTQVINDRGIHICKSMLAWKNAGLNETPESTGIKGDKLVGKYYVEFDKALKNELQPLLDRIYEKQDLSVFTDKEKETISKHLEKLRELNTLLEKEIETIEVSAYAALGVEFKEAADEMISTKSGAKNLIKLFESIEKPDATKKELLKKIRPIHSLESKMGDIKAEIKELAQNKTQLMKDAQQMLQLWEKQDPEVLALWKTMNGWVYDGFNATYKTIGVDFDHLYYESETYLLGKDIVLEGLEKGVFFRKEDGSVWCDLTAEGLDEKVVLRSDGTSVYITQDIGTALLRFEHYPDVNGMIYTVGNEQDYHFKVLFHILKKLGYSWANECFHLSYGMVDLPSGKMKSREGTVVDADDLAAEMISEAEQKTRELGKIDDIAENDRAELFHTLGMGALKYFILKVDPRKRMLFNPAESIDFQGNTGPFIQYTHARIRSLLRKADGFSRDYTSITTLLPEEKEILQVLGEFPSVVKEGAKEFSPAVVANYLYELVKSYNHLYQNTIILKETDEAKRALRLSLSEATANTIKTGMQLIGIKVPEKM